MSGWFTWAPRKSVATRRAEAAREVAASRKRGGELAPVVLAGRKIAETFWGKAWCDNLERYRDFAYRLERGRSYLRSGSVIDLQIAAGKVSAKVLGSSLYTITIEIDAVAQPAWRAIQRDCAGGIGSRIDLLAGTLSEAVMTRLCADRAGLFPHPAAIRFDCSCPDHANVCKHVAAAMYGIGARLDQSPELLFTLRRVSLDELVAAAVTALPAAPSPGRVLANDGLAALFGIELADGPAAPAPAPSRARRRDADPSKRAAATTSGTADPARIRRTTTVSPRAIASVPAANAKRRAATASPPRAIASVPAANAKRRAATTSPPRAVAAPPGPRGSSKRLKIQVNTPRSSAMSIRPSPDRPRRKETPHAEVHVDRRRR